VSASYEDFESHIAYEETDCTINVALDAIRPQTDKLPLLIA
jgi:hypothetical protein